MAEDRVSHVSPFRKDWSFNLAMCCIITENNTNTHTATHSLFPCIWSVHLYFTGSLKKITGLLINSSLRHSCLHCACKSLTELCNYMQWWLLWRNFRLSSIPVMSHWLFCIHSRHLMRTTSVSTSAGWVTGQRRWPRLAVLMRASFKRLGKCRGR